jgi:hypothetical protein
VSNIDRSPVKAAKYMDISSSDLSLVSGRYDHRNQALARHIIAKTKKNPGHVNHCAKLKKEEAMRVAMIRLGLEK